MSVFIINFQSPKDIDELILEYNEYGSTNIDWILNDAMELHETKWTVPSYSEYGDTVIFACASTAKNHMGHVCVQAKDKSEEIIRFAEDERAMYRQYSGKLIAIGTIGEMPWPDDNYGSRAYSAKIINLKLFDDPLNVSDFKGHISLNRFSAHTKLNGWQWELIKRRIKIKER